MDVNTANICPRCGATFSCGMKVGREPCWCSQLPALDAPQDLAQGCYCPACLSQLLEIQAEKPASGSS